MKELHRKRTIRVLTLALAALSAAAACGGEDPANDDLQSTIGDAGEDSSGGSGNGAGGSESGGSQTGPGDPPMVTIDAGNNGGAGGADDECGGEAVEASQRVVNLLLLIDKSGSMEGVPDGFDSDKWSSMKQAIADALEPVEEALNMGLQFFPDPANDASGDEASCGLPGGSDLTVDIRAGIDAVPMIEQALDDSAPTGATPTAAALARALDYYTEGAGADLEGDRVVLLATDGGPNCNDSLECEATECTQNIEGICVIPDVNCCDGTPTGCLDAQGSIDQVIALRDAGVRTFVIGIPGSEDYADVLDDLAEEGGAKANDTSPKYYEVSDGEALGEVLQSITIDLVKTCEFQLEMDPPELGKVNVFTDGEVVPKGDEGWTYDHSTDPPTVILLGETCERIETEGADSIEFRFGCPTVEVL